MVSDRQLTFRSCLLGTILGTLGCAALYYLGFLAVGDVPRKAVLFLPEKLGLVNEVDAHDILIIAPDSENEILLPRRGKYEVYTFDGRSASYQIVIEPVSGDDKVQVTPADTTISGQAIQVTNTALPEHLVPTGESVSYLAYIVRAGGAGSYRIVATGQTPRAAEQKLLLVPSVANQNAAVAIFGGLVQLGIILLAIWLVYRFLNRDKLRARQAARKQKSEAWESVFSAPEQADRDAS